MVHCAELLVLGEFHATPLKFLAKGPKITAYRVPGDALSSDQVCQFPGIRLEPEPFGLPVEAFQRQAVNGGGILAHFINLEVNVPGDGSVVLNLNVRKLTNLVCFGSGELGVNND